MSGDLVAFLKAAIVEAERERQHHAAVQGRIVHVNRQGGTMRHRKRSSSAEVYRKGWRDGYAAALVEYGPEGVAIPEPPDRREGASEVYLVLDDVLNVQTPPAASEPDWQKLRGGVMAHAVPADRFFSACGIPTHQLVEASPDIKRCQRCEGKL